jgi:uncharacterized SAM-binding protein YcdF (DUF218 family)
MQYEAIIVLGPGVNTEGQLGEHGHTTLTRALAVWQKWPQAYLIMSGGLSYNQTSVPRRSEAQAMKDYAVAHGVPSERILTESESRDTLGNVYFSRVNLLDPLNLHVVMVVGTPHHSLARLDYICQKVFGNEVTYEVELQDELARAHEDREAESLKYLQALLNDVADGDTVALYARLRSKHPAYRL